MSKKRWVVILLSAILLFHFFDSFFWLKKDSLVNGVDAGSHILEAVKYHAACHKTLLSRDSFVSKALQLIQVFRNWRATLNWPPMIYFLSALISPHEVQMFGLRLYVNFIFYILLVLSTYFLGKKCFNRRVGLMAAFLVGFYPAVCAYSRQFGLDFPLLCVTAACLCLLVYSENFSKRGYSLLFGLSLGMGLLVKLQILFFLWMPWLVTALGVFRQKNSEKLNGFLNLMLSFAIAFGLFSFYWGDKIGTLSANLYDHAFIYYPFYAKRIALVSGASIPTLSLKSATFYFESLLFHASLFPFMIFAVALAVFPFCKSRWRIFYLLSFLSAYLSISLISVKWTRYALPLLPFMAILSAWGIDSFRSGYVKMLIFGALVFSTVNFCYRNSWTSEKYELVPRPFSLLAGSDRAFSRPYPPDTFDYIGELKKTGVIPFIEQKIKMGKMIRMKFCGMAMETSMVLLYFYFQDAVLDGKIIMEGADVSYIQDADCVLIPKPDVLSVQWLSKNFRMLSRTRESAFLIKNEKDFAGKTLDGGGSITYQS